METLTARIISGLGGTSAVARLIEAPISTVHSWKVEDKIPASRLAHLKLAAKAAEYDMDWETGELISGPSKESAAA